MAERIVVVGAGGFGRETLDVVEALIAAGEPLQLLGVVDSGPRQVDLGRLGERGIIYLGTEEEWLPRRPVTLTDSPSHSNSSPRLL